MVRAACAAAALAADPTDLVLTGEFAPADRATRAVNDTVAADDRVDSVMLALRDGVTLARRR